MSFKLTIVLFVIFASLLIVGGWFVFKIDKTEQSVQSSESIEVGPLTCETCGKEEPIISEPKPLPEPLPNFILLDVPFTPQAPFAEWQDPIYQNACEEAALVMAIYWLRNQSLTIKKASEEIFALAQYEKQSYGHFHDTSAADTLKLFKDFYDYQNVDLFYDISIEDIKIELSQGNLVIVPVNGQKLGNPYYTLPGPLEHMLVIRGYDDALQEFTVNDPGTRQGEAYRYDYQVIEKAMRDYPSGYHGLITEVKTAMIVIKQIE